jgi:hypothetical protein
MFLFSVTSRPDLGATQPSVQFKLGVILQGVKRPEREVEHCLPPSVKVNNNSLTPQLPNQPL